jgi:hypothetical protein
VRPARSLRISTGVTNGDCEWFAVLRFLEALMRPNRAVDNARQAATELSRRRVERTEVELFLAERGQRVTKSA